MEEGECHHSPGSTVSVMYTKTSSQEADWEVVSSITKLVKSDSPLRMPLGKSMRLTTVSVFRSITRILGGQVRS